MPTSFTGFLLPTTKALYWPVGTIKNCADFLDKAGAKVAQDIATMQSSNNVDALKREGIEALNAEFAFGKKIFMGTSTGVAAIQTALLYFKLVNVKKAVEGAYLVKNSTNYLQKRLINVAT